MIERRGAAVRRTVRVYGVDRDMLWATVEILAGDETVVAA